MSELDHEKTHGSAKHDGLSIFSLLHFFTLCNCDSVRTDIDFYIVHDSSEQNIK